MLKQKYTYAQISTQSYPPTVSMQNMHPKQVRLLAGEFISVLFFEERREKNWMSTLSLPMILLHLMMTIHHDAIPLMEDEIISQQNVWIQTCNVWKHVTCICVLCFVYETSSGYFTLNKRNLLCPNGILNRSM